MPQLNSPDPSLLILNHPYPTSSPSQDHRELAIKAFKAGKFSVLVATDVAARGLDIAGVELVIQTSPPKDHESYIHRSGRTGRAGTTGVSITLVTRSREEQVSWPWHAGHKQPLSV